MTWKKLTPSEHEEQVALFDWAGAMRGTIPEVAMLFAIPLGGWRQDGVGRRMAREGVQPGIPDCFLACPRGGYAGLWLELKVKPNTLTPEQRVWKDALERQGYRVAVCYSWTEAVDVILDYLGVCRPMHKKADSRVELKEELEQLPVKP